MGEIAHVDLDRLRALADGFWGVAADVAGMSWPEPDGSVLPASAVGAIPAADLIAEQVATVIAGLTSWAMAARASAEAFAHADAVNGDRFAVR